MESFHIPCFSSLSFPFMYSGLHLISSNSRIKLLYRMSLVDWTSERVFGIEIFFLIEQKIRLLYDQCWTEWLVDLTSERALGIESFLFLFFWIISSFITLFAAPFYAISSMRPHNISLNISKLFINCGSCYHHQ